MNNISKEEYELGLLILESLEGSVQKEQFGELEKRINADPAAARQYLDQVMNHSVLMWRCESLIPDTGIIESPEDTKFLNAMGEYEKLAPAVEMKLPDNQPELITDVIKPARTARQINKVSLLIAVTSLAALIVLLAYVYLNPGGSTEMVATMTDSIDAVWGDSHVPVNESNIRMKAHTGPLELKKGYVKIVYNYGTEVILEGPTEFEILGPEEMSVIRGQVYARAPSSAIGFTVSTPNSKIIDLGTEFGVKVGGDGSTDVHMIKGKASLIAGQKGDTKLNEIVHEGIAKRVDSHEQMKDIKLQEDLFARQISSETGIIWRGEDVNLADIIGGGNGLGIGQPGRGISLNTGKQIFDIQEEAKDKLPGGYISVPEIKQIDGVFVPDVAGGSKVVITSTGDGFENCPDTSGKHFSGIYYGQASQSAPNEYFTMVLNGQAAVSLKPAICMYGNAGVTFDLDAIRQSIPQCRIKAFRAVCGLSPNPATSRSQTAGSLADMFVLVDGKVAFEALAVSRFSEQKKINIALHPTDRFLTLVGTDGGSPLGSDWTVFAEPYLELTLED